jgi:hypothetical protein
VKECEGCRFPHHSRAVSLSLSTVPILGRLRLRLHVTAQAPGLPDNTGAHGQAFGLERAQAGKNTGRRIA